MNLLLITIQNIRITYNFASSYLSKYYSTKYSNPYIFFVFLGLVVVELVLEIPLVHLYFLHL